MIKDEKKIILLKLWRKNLTANELIDELYAEDLSMGMKHIVDRGWRYWVHINKLFSPMEKSGLIKLLNDEDEKIWQITPEGVEILKESNSDL